MTVMQNGMYIFFVFIYITIIKQSRNVTFTYYILTNFWKKFNLKNTVLRHICDANYEGSDGGGGLVFTIH